MSTRLDDTDQQRTHSSHRTPSRSTPTTHSFSTTSNCASPSPPLLPPSATPQSANMSAFVPSTTPIHAPHPRVKAACPLMQSPDAPSTPPPANAPQASPTSASTTSSQHSSATDVCEECGREGGRAAGCDGNGRIIGGLGAVVGWWPIKAYRPCPDFLKAKKKYRRAGQSLDEIAFGRKASGDDLSIGERLRGK